MSRLAVFAAVPPVPASLRPPQTNQADSTVDPAGSARSALVELVVNESSPASNGKAIVQPLLFRLSEFPVPPRAVVQVALVGQDIWLLPVSAIAPFSWAFCTPAVNGWRTAASAGVGPVTAPTTAMVATSASTVAMLVARRARPRHDAMLQEERNFC